MDDGNEGYQTVRSIRYNYVGFSKPGLATSTVKERKIDSKLGEDGPSSVFASSSRPKGEECSKFCPPTNKIVRVKRKPIKTTAEIDAKIRMPPPKFPPPRYRPITKSHVSLGSPAKLKPTLTPVNPEEEKKSTSSSLSSSSSSATTTIPTATTTTVGEDGGIAPTTSNLKFVPFELSKCVPRKISPFDLAKPLPPLINAVETDSEFPKEPRISVKTRKIYINPRIPKLQPAFNKPTSETNNNKTSLPPRTISTVRLRKLVNLWATKLGKQSERDELKLKSKRNNSSSKTFLFGSYFSSSTQSSPSVAQHQLLNPSSTVTQPSSPLTSAFSSSAAAAAAASSTTSAAVQFSALNYGSGRMQTKASVKEMCTTSPSAIAGINFPQDIKVEGSATINSMKRARDECLQDSPNISPSKKLKKTTTIKTEVVSTLNEDGTSKLAKSKKSKTKKKKKKRKMKHLLKDEIDRRKKTEATNNNNNTSNGGCGDSGATLKSSISEMLSNEILSNNNKSTCAAELNRIERQSSSSPSDVHNNKKINNSNSNEFSEKTSIASRLLTIRNNLKKLTNGTSSSSASSSEMPSSTIDTSKTLKTTLSISPVVKHTIELLQQKREIQARLEDPESNGLVCNNNRTGNLGSSSSSSPLPHKGELLLNNVPMDAGEVKNVIMKRLAVGLAQEGFTHSKLQPFEILGDVVDDFFVKMTSRLKQIRERELAGVDHGFPDPMERVLVEIGMGGVRGLESFMEKEKRKRLYLEQSLKSKLNADY